MQKKIWKYGTVLAAILDDDNDGGQIDEVRTDTVTYSGAPVDMEMCRQQVLASTLTLSQSWGQIMPNLHWCPHQVLKATGAPVH